MLRINKDSRLPLYYQLSDAIAEKIESGEWGAHTKLPSERELCDIYGVSRATVRQAMQELEINGYIYKVQGKGTFVNPKKIKQDLLKFYSFTEEMKKLGKTPSSSVIDFSVVKCNEKVAKKMRLKPGDPVYQFTRLRLADNEPMMLETTYIPCHRFPGITREMLEARPLYDILTEEHKARLTMAEEIFTPVLVRKNEAELLQYMAQSPGMMIERLTYEEDAIIEYTKGIARGDKFEYRVVLK
ncbi:MAG: GntR family transcriptional regulator [Firmicutes bacterium]|nr:GntR family transcriptional regulator [Bacillota bacterium]